jgi:hypothetical protein
MQFQGPGSSSGAAIPLNAPNGKQVLSYFDNMLYMKANKYFSFSERIGTRIAYILMSAEKGSARLP